MKPLLDFEKGFSEIETEVEMRKKVQTEKAVDRRSIRQCVAEDFEVPYRMTQRDELWDCDDGAENFRTTRQNFSRFLSLCRIDANAKSSLRRNDRDRSTGIQSEPQIMDAFWALDFRIANNNACFKIQAEPLCFLHVGLKSSSITFGELIRSACHVCSDDAIDVLQLLVNLVPVRAVGEETASKRRGRRFIHFGDLDEQPFAAPFVPFLDRFNRFDFHKNVSIPWQKN